MGNRSAIPFHVLALAAAFSASCSRTKSIDRDQIRSEIRLARSFAAESEMFIDFVLEGRATRPYAEEHAAYLEDAVEQSAKEIEGRATDSVAEDSVRECRAQLAMIARELSGIRGAVSDTNALGGARERIRQIRERLEQADAYP